MKGTSAAISLGLLLILLSSIMSSVTSSNYQPNINIPNDKDFIVTTLQNQFNWSLPQYDGWSCVNQSSVVYDYLISNNYNCRIVRGYNSTRLKGHSWIMIQIDDAWYDYECTSLRFKDITKYDISNVYINKELVKWY